MWVMGRETDQVLGKKSQILVLLVDIIFGIAEHPAKHKTNSIPPDLLIFVREVKIFA